MSRVELERILPVNRHSGFALGIVRFTCCGRKGACSPDRVPENARCWVCEPRTPEEM